MAEHPFQASLHLHRPKGGRLRRWGRRLLWTWGGNVRRLLGRGCFAKPALGGSEKRAGIAVVGLEGEYVVRALADGSSVGRRQRGLSLIQQPVDLPLEPIATHAQPLFCCPFQRQELGKTRGPAKSSTKGTASSIGWNAHVGWQRAGSEAVAVRNSRWPTGGGQDCGPSTFTSSVQPNGHEGMIVSRSDSAHADSRRELLPADVITPLAPR
jgi:hypothetical protein